MSDFVIRKKEKRRLQTKTVSFAKPTRKELSLVLKIIVFTTVFSGIIFSSISSNNSMLSELLISGGILSAVFLIHILSDR